jgi:hypothetical protein
MQMEVTAIGLPSDRNSSETVLVRIKVERMTTIPPVNRKSPPHSSFLQQQMHHYHRLQYDTMTKGGNCVGSDLKPRLFKHLKLSVLLLGELHHLGLEYESRVSRDDIAESTGT